MIRKNDPRLIPCPFCGSTEDVHLLSRTRREPYLGRWYTQYYVSCADEFDGCGAVSGYWGSEEEAIAAWNRRVAEDAETTIYDLRDKLQRAVRNPRVLTWDELWDEGHPQTVWVEDPNYTNSFIEVHYDAEGFPGENEPIYITENRQYWFDNSDVSRNAYGRRANCYYFRAWSKEPTERQRKEVEWDG